ncbi:hypothetical protein B2G69_09005 [Methylorubrum zatmanii]|nr:YdeI/OmpD-associated family protein [Methylorubrum zatmanii]ARO54277.1 hypothetical protein B2G69_09005 [Methylorubrum zatmanii]KQQ14007.1 hypothetical protein ASF59_21290 [Methylobacterium sp. Leaf121]
MITHEGLPILLLPTQAAWDGWLSSQGASSAGAWLKFAKKGSGQTTLSKAEAIEAALAYGWVDGQLDKFDDQFWLVRFTRRGLRSRWSQVNCEIAAQLLAEGRMAPAGLAAVQAGRSDGRWEAAYAPQSSAEVPEELRAALDAEPKAAAFFATLTGANRYAVIYRVSDARTAKTRVERIAKFVAMLARGETLHPSSRRKAEVEHADRQG